jgi:imidazolonepropionase-like amidohydrolase
VSTGSVAFALAYRSPGDELWGDDPLPRLVRERDNLLPGILNEFAEPELAKGALDYHKALSDPAYFAKKQSLPVPAVKFFTAAAVYGSANMKKLYQTGAKFGCGNDGGVPFVFPGAMWLEMTLMQESGVKPAEVLRAATLTNAKILNLERSIGTVNTGRIADLAVFEKNPLEDARNLRKPICVLQAGRVVHRAA